MSAPTKCENCGATATYAIQVPCVMQCGGLMYYDHSAVSMPDSGDAPRALSSPFLDAFREKLVRGESLTHDEAAQLLDAHDSLMAAYHDVGVLSVDAPRAEPHGTTACPICGRDNPHHHSEVEIAEYQNDQLASREEIEAAVLAAPRSVMMTTPEWRLALAAAFAVRATVREPPQASAPDGLRAALEALVENVTEDAQRGWSHSASTEKVLNEARAALGSAPRGTPEDQ